MSGTPDGADNGATESDSTVSLDSALSEAWNSDWDDEAWDSLASEDDDTEPSDDSDEDQGDEPEPDEDVDNDEAVDDTDSTDPEKFTVKVDGEDIEVTLDELLGGYTRQADYTRKTQALASERERYAAFEALSDALQKDPQGTLSKLARLYDVDPNAAQEPDPLEDADPALAAEIRELREFKQDWQADREQRAAAERAAAVDREIEAVRAKFNETDLDDGALLQYAVDHGINNLEAAYKAMRFEQASTAKKADTSKVVERKRKAPPVEGGRNRSSKGVRKGVDPKDLTLEAAFEIALAGK